MSLYDQYLQEIETRKNDLGLNPKPIDSAELLAEIIDQIKDPANGHRKDSLHYFIYNTLPGTTAAAGVKAKFLKEIILNGTQGSAHLSSDHLQIALHSGKNEEYGANAATGGGADPMAFSHAWHQAVIEDFADALQSGRDPAITGRSALAVHALIDAINLSDKTGQRVTVEANDD